MRCHRLSIPDRVKRQLRIRPTVSFTTMTLCLIDSIFFLQVGRIKQYDLSYLGRCLRTEYLTLIAIPYQFG
ncbi:hypothetical protein ES703_63701 [subsurface metagenome]